MHDIHEDTVKGIKQLLKELDAKGYQFVTIDTLIKEDPEYLLNPKSNLIKPSTLK